MDTKRKQMLRSLLDALTELQQEEGPISNDARPEPKPGNSDGVGSFFTFERRAKDFDDMIAKFTLATRQLGSSEGIAFSAHRLRPSILEIIYLFHRNTSNVFQSPELARRLKEHPKWIGDEGRSEARKQEMKILRALRNILILPAVSRAVHPLELSDFPSVLKRFGKDLEAFRSRINEIPEFISSHVNNPIGEFRDDVHTWASDMESFVDFECPATQYYVLSICGKMGKHLHAITPHLLTLLEIAIPTNQLAQQSETENLSNLSTIATFFSAVTATMLSLSYGNTGTPVENAVNSFWFMSLVFSIASAVNSLLALTWVKTTYRTPGHGVPWFVQIWMKRTPLVFLVLAVAAFLVGLCLFTYSSGQNGVTSALTTVFTCFSAFGLMSISTWFLFERWAFLTYGGEKWPLEAFNEFCQLPFRPFYIDDSQMPLTDVLRMVYLQVIWTPIRRRFRGFSARILKWINSELRSSSGLRSEADEAESTASSSPERNRMAIRTRFAHSDSSISRVSSDRFNSTGPQISVAPSNNTSTRTSSPPFNRSARASPTTSRYDNPRTSSAFSNTTGPQASPTPSNYGDPRISSAPASSSSAHEESAMALITQASRPASSKLPSDSGIVELLQICPNGEFLAIRSMCSDGHRRWNDYYVYRVKKPMRLHRTLTYSGHIEEIVWSPNGKMLLFLNDGNSEVTVWTAESGVRRCSIELFRYVRAISWYPDSDEFLYIEGASVVKRDLDGNILTKSDFTYDLTGEIYSVTITKDKARFFGVVEWAAFGKVEKQGIIIFNLCRSVIHTIPIAHQIRDLIVAKSGDGSDVLVTYEDEAPPQLWKFEFEEEGAHRLIDIANISVPIDRFGPCCFGGKDDQLILFAEEAGAVHIYDRRSRSSYKLDLPSSGVQAQNCVGLAWNQASTSFVSVLRGRDGTVRLWTSEVKVHDVVKDDPSQSERMSPDEPELLLL